MVDPRLEWVSVDVALPVDLRPVLVVCDDVWITGEHCRGLDIVEYDIGSWRRRRVTYWRELPRLPPESAGPEETR